MPRKDEVRVHGWTFPVVGRIRLGGRDYLLLERLSGQRERFRAYDPVAGDLRALCLLPLGKSTWQHLGVLKRLSQDNKNFPSLLEYHRHKNQIAVLSLWVPGYNLRYLLRQGRDHPHLWPSAYEAFRILRGLAHGISQLHRHANCVHGDVKPENVILAPQPQRAVLIDFGSAWTAERTIGRVAGDGHTDAYAAPELHRGQAFVDFRADQFSVSAVAYELLTGELPYDHLGGRAGRPELIGEFRGQLVPPSSRARRVDTLPSNIWPLVDKVLLRGLALDPGERFLNDGGPWLAELDTIAAEMKLRPTLNVFHRCMLKVFGAIDNLFSRSPTP